ncbi:MAG: hypothetical protein JRG91_13520 [Deltaproteobacteria bacterium]|nr:hypothetical protein [Deltaproteobacteria bacterium]
MMRHTLWTFILLVTAGCSAGTRTPASVSGEENVAPQEVSPPQEKASGCPASFAEAKGGCVHGGQLPSSMECTYPEGECWCGETPRCSGAYMIPMPPETWVWNCVSPPPEVRADGCSGASPNHGDACAEEGKSCSYGDCCVLTMTCVNGQWTGAGPGCPP